MIMITGTPSRRVHRRKREKEKRREDGERDRQKD
jgi:hypothetical protein